MSGLYIHIPFCKQACSYCDFYFVTRTSEREHFVDQLIREIQDYEGTAYTSESVETIYFGGGTPSLLEPKQVERILHEICRIFPLDLDEITFEVNPDDVTKEFLQALKSIGITRLSMGVQTFQPELLEKMNRAHSRDEALQCLEVLQQSRFNSFTVDLIYGNPGQTLDQLNSDIELLLEFDPPHISAYSLTVEPDTRLGRQVELGRIVAPEDDAVAQHFDLVYNKLKEHGIQRYEVSNYSKPGCEAVHNSNYWKHYNYLGLGPGAHSFWWEEKVERWEQKRDLRAYLRGEDIQTNREILTREQLAEERLMMGLRTREGVGVKELERRYDYSLNDRQKRYLEDRQAEQKMLFDERIKLTDEGIKIADAIILDLVTLY
ncbi:radical SAM family heme chaperone HemW [Fodinibius salsisoli]|uniref:Heme chaperone HemW n=1 Tax=Fodinibius salsisoli TaxID=2820877 RepID=A0ABT3PLZ3_9BACT|nr:radical SAM family heme chaperone HemW [Fodinibius salsisoli]